MHTFGSVGCECSSGATGCTIAPLEERTTKTKREISLVVLSLVFVACCLSFVATYVLYLHIVRCTHTCCVLHDAGGAASTWARSKVLGHVACIAERAAVYRSSQVGFPVLGHVACAAERAAVYRSSQVGLPVRPCSLQPANGGLAAVTARTDRRFRVCAYSVPINSGKSHGVAWYTALRTLVPASACR